ncbi:hypothetical protein [Deinococcus sp. YIM 77859]|uniref:hypothetical protein n=1 Tax=Deinococcus sp. YIM 77859 TaxID=1540221 RepID=UPI000552C2FC|nr:hypothetical protein [Deinococcus sp. YIM 77859]
MHDAPNDREQREQEDVTVHAARALRREDLTIPIIMSVFNVPVDEARILLAYYQGRGISDVRVSVEP